MTLVNKMSRNLIIFKKEQYPYLKKEYGEKGYNLFSFSRTSNTKALDNLLDINNKLIIDISSLGNSILPDNGSLYNFEQLLQYFSVETIFISDIDNVDYRYKLRYCFDYFVEYKKD
jgi:hypothetical protein